MTDAESPTHSTFFLFYLIPANETAQKKEAQTSFFYYYCIRGFP